MSPISPVVSFLAITYLGAFAGCVIALAARRAWRNRTDTGAADTALLALLPIIGAAALHFGSHARIAGVELPTTLHYLWHDLTGTLPDMLLAHSALHAANLLVLALATIGLVRVIYALARQSGLLAALSGTSRPFGDWNGIPVVSLETDRPVCLVAGFLRPRIFVSRDLLEGLTGQEREAMFAHEAAHVRRRDTILSSILFAFYTFLSLPGGRGLYAAWRSAAEQACDGEAARQVGDPCAVASALVEAARMGCRPSVAGLAAFAAEGSDLEVRVGRLIAADFDARGGSFPWARAAAVTGLVVVAVTLCEPMIRHLVESFVHH